MHIILEYATLVVSLYIKTIVIEIAIYFKKCRDVGMCLFFYGILSVDKVGAWAGLIVCLVFVEIGVEWYSTFFSMSWRIAIFFLNNVFRALVSKIYIYIFKK